jgi:hypothetical protein
MERVIEYHGPNGESYFQTIYIDLSNFDWNMIIEEDGNGNELQSVTMFEKSNLDNYCEKIPDRSREEFKDLIYSRIYNLRKRINRKITRTELVLGKFGTLVSIEGIGGRQS